MIPTEGPENRDSEGLSKTMWETDAWPALVLGATLLGVGAFFAYSGSFFTHSRSPFAKLQLKLLCLQWESASEPLKLGLNLKTNLASR